MKYVLSSIVFVLIGLMLLPASNALGLFYVIDQLTHFQMQYIAVASFVGLVMLLISRTLAVALIGLCWCIFTLQNIALIFNGSSSENKGDKVSFIQANLSYYNPDIDEALLHLKAKKADVYLFFEVNQKHKSKFISFKPDFYRFGDGDLDGFPDGMGVISRYPITDITRHQVIPGKGAIITMTLSINHKPLSLTLLHPPSARNKLNWQKRNLLLDSVAPLISQSTTPYQLVAGDLNITPWSTHFPKHFTLTPCINQSGLYSSWYAHVKLNSFGLLGGIPIDHCLTNHAVTVTDFETLPIIGSDHHGLSYQLSF